MKRVYAKKIHRKYYKNQEINGLEMQMDPEQIRRLTCVACGKKYVRQLTEDDHAEEVCEEICQTIYDIAMMRKKDDQNGEA